MNEIFAMDILDEHEFNGDYVFDTNVWIHLESPYTDPNTHEAKNYSRIYKHILQDGGSVHITPTIISEFINHVLKTNFFVEKDNGNFGGNFKDYRQTEDYKSSARYVGDWFSDFIADCSVIPATYTVAQYKTFADTLGSCSLDFSDLIIAAECNSQNLILVTHDSDFKGSGLNILSANPTYK